MVPTSSDDWSILVQIKASCIFSCQSYMIIAKEILPRTWIDLISSGLVWTAWKAAISETWESAGEINHKKGQEGENTFNNFKHKYMRNVPVMYAACHLYMRFVRVIFMCWFPCSHKHTIDCLGLLLKYYYMHGLTSKTHTQYEYCILLVPSINQLHTPPLLFKTF